MTCKELNCQIQCNLLNKSECPLLGIANAAYDKHMAVRMAEQIIKEVQK